MVDVLPDSFQWRTVKAAAKRAFMRDGRWGKFTLRRDWLKEHEGLDGKEAWARVLLEPDFEFDSKELENRVPVVPADTYYAQALIRPDSTKPNYDDFADKPPATIRVGLEWAFEAIGTRGVKAEDAPSVGAWALLEWARSSEGNTNKFYDMCMKLLPNKSQVAAVEDEVVVPDKVIDVIDRLTKKEPESA